MAVPQFCSGCFGHFRNSNPSLQFPVLGFLYDPSHIRQYRCRMRTLTLTITTVSDLPLAATIMIRNEGIASFAHRFMSFVWWLTLRSPTLEVFWESFKCGRLRHDPARTKTGHRTYKQFRPGYRSMISGSARLRRLVKFTR